MSNEAVSDDDIFVLIMLSPWLLPILAAGLFGYSEGAREWALEYHLLADKHQAIIEIPGGDGVGIGGVQIVVLSCLLVGFVVVASVLSRRRRAAPIGGQSEPAPFRPRL